MQFLFFLKTDKPHNGEGANATTKATLIKVQVMNKFDKKGGWS